MRSRFTAFKNDSLIEADLPEEVNSAAATATKGTDDERLDTLVAASKGLLDSSNHGSLVLVWSQQSEVLALSSGSDSKSTGCRSSKSSMEAERSYATPTSIVQKLEVVKGSPTPVESGKDFGPTALLLEAVSELDVSMGERIGRFGELL